MSVTVSHGFTVDCSEGRCALGWKRCPCCFGGPRVDDTTRLCHGAHDVEVEVVAGISPAEKRTHEHPGCEASFEVEEVQGASADGVPILDELAACLLDETSDTLREAVFAAGEPDLDEPEPDDYFDDCRRNRP